MVNREGNKIICDIDFIGEENSWYIILTKANYVKKVANSLTSLGFENYLPLQKQLRIWHDRKKWIEVPAFGSYMFIKTNEKLRLKTFEVNGIIKYISVGGKLSTISEKEITSLKKIFSFDGEATICEGKFELGDRVEILNGYFKGFTGNLVQTNANKQLKIAIKEIGYNITVDITHSLVKKG